MTQQRRIGISASCLLCAAGLAALITSNEAFGLSAKRQVSETVSAPSLSPAASVSAPNDTSEQASNRLQPLSRVMDRSLTGLDFESPDYQSWVRTKAEQYATLIAKSPQTPAMITALAECQTQNTRHPFCQFLENPAAAKKRLGDIPHSTLTRKKRQKFRVIDAMIAKANLKGLEAASDRDVRATLRKYRSFKSLKKLTDAVLSDAESCKSPKLSYLLGAKTEEFLPDLEMRQTATALYLKSADCDHLLSPQAKYRLSLLLIWAGECPKALPYLQQLAYTIETKDYRSRALFWKAECSQKAGEEETVASAKRRLQEKHPFSLHTLVGQSDSIPQIRSVLEGTDSMVRFRSAIQPELNELVASTEALIATGKDRIAEKILGALGSQMDDTEPEFQLYVAYLLNRVGDFLGKFRLMSQLLHDNPNLVSWSSLALYYPRSDLNTDIVKKAGLDEFLVLSLIRQESAFNQNAHSRAGARGLMQVMPATARLIERRRISTRDLYNPEINMKIGSKYFAFLLKKYNGDAELALAAYNAGPKRVEEWMKRYPVENRMLFLDLVPFRETREYVASIARNFFWYSLLYSEPLTSGTQLAPTASDVPGAKQAADSFPGSLRNVFKLFGT